MVRRVVAPKQFISGFRARFLARSAWNDIFSAKIYVSHAPLRKRTVLALCVSLCVCFMFAVVFLGCLRCWPGTFYVEINSCSQFA